MPINSCVKVEWKDIFLDGAIFKNTEDIPVIIEIKSLNNPSLVNSAVVFSYKTQNLTNTKSTTEGDLIKVSEQPNLLVLETKLTPEDDLWDIPIDCLHFNINFSLVLTTPDSCDLCVGKGNFYITKENEC